MKKFLAMLLCVVMVACMMPVMAADTVDVWDGSIASGFAGGTGTEDDPYQIANSAQLAYLAQQVNVEENRFENKYIKLTADIDLNNCNWTPIYSANAYFRGNVDGAGHTITGLNVSSSEDQAGLFGMLYGGTIKNLNVVGTVTGKSEVGGIVGTTSNAATVTNCTFTGTVTGGSYVGGIVGWNYGTVEGCSTSGKVVGGDRIGGIAGMNFIKVYNCHNNAEISGTGITYGGIVAENNGTVENCYNTGVVTGGNQCGGIVGFNNQDNAAVKNSFNTAEITGTSAVGSLVGNNTVSETCIENCFYSAEPAVGQGHQPAEGRIKPIDNNLAYNLNAWIKQQDDSGIYSTWTIKDDDTVEFGEPPTPPEGTHAEHDGITDALAVTAGDIAGNYYLTDDVVLTAPLSVSSATTICLNGHTLYLNGYVLTVNDSLTICDCTGTGMVTGGGHIAVTGATAELVLAGGSVTGLNGGVKLSQGGKLTVSGGRLYGNTK